VKSSCVTRGYRANTTSKGAAMVVPRDEWIDGGMLDQ
jgi:hypothetical protein